MAEIFFLLKKILTPLILPPTGPLSCAILGLLLLGRWPRIGKSLAWGGMVVLLALSLPATASLLLNAVVMESGLDSSDARAAQAIVILGGGYKSAPEYGGATISSQALERVRYGAKLARERRLPVLVTGGTVYGSGTPEGTMMAAVLRESFATETAWIEARARDTHENALFSAAILKANGIRTVLLVTHDLHERRAWMEFSAAGIEAVPAPVSVGARDRGPASFAERLPTASALYLSSQVLHEIIGTALLAPRTTAVR